MKYSKQGLIVKRLKQLTYFSSQVTREKLIREVLSYIKGKEIELFFCKRCNEDALVTKIKRVITKAVANKVIFKDGEFLVLTSKAESIDFFSEEPIIIDFANVWLPFGIHKKTAGIMKGDLILLAMITNLGKTVTAIETFCKNVMKGRKTLLCATETSKEDLQLSFRRRWYPTIFEEHKKAAEEKRKIDINTEYPFPDKVKRAIEKTGSKVITSDGQLSSIINLKDFECVIYDHLQVKESDDYMKLAPRMVAARDLAKKNNQVIIITAQVKKKARPKRGEDPWHLVGGPSLINPTTITAIVYKGLNKQSLVYLDKNKRGKSNLQLKAVRVTKKARLKTEEVKD